jgi:hypothetical protein
MSDEHSARLSAEELNKLASCLLPADWVAMSVRLEVDARDLLFEVLHLALWHDKAVQDSLARGVNSSDRCKLLGAFRGGDELAVDGEHCKRFIESPNEHTERLAGEADPFALIGREAERVGEHAVALSERDKAPPAREAARIGIFFPLARKALLAGDATLPASVALCELHRSAAGKRGDSAFQSMLGSACTTPTPPAAASATALGRGQRVNQL